MLSEPCPRCGKNATVTGGSIIRWVVMRNSCPTASAGWSTSRRRIFKTTIAKLRDPARGCLDCGLVWATTLHPGELREIVQREGIAIGVKKTDPEI